MPRSRVLSVVLVAILAALALAPFLFPGTRSLNVAAKVCVFVLLVASYDLLLGYTGIVSFAHTMFFGIGGYGVAHRRCRKLGPDLGQPRARHRSPRSRCRRCCRSLIGLLSLRVKAIFFAMITLAVASFFAILASQLSDLTGGEDGLTFKLPELLRRERLLATCSASTSTAVVLLPRVLRRAALFLALLRVVNSPFGRVLLAIRENEFRAEAIGYRTRHLPHRRQLPRGASPPRSPGVLYALWLRYTGPEHHAVASTS